ncbi:MAG: ubiquinone biosynthesis methyltransferase UbiE, partial [Paenibacillus sp.]|nr:ubiquinone biosynthesis methyltransferase UbiE [Paenibacillus sp.]
METNSSKSHVHSLFETIAPKYDFMNDVISFRRHKAWRKYTMKKMNVQRGQTAIDICCGTCDWTIDLANAGAQGGIIGLDFSQNMLDVGAEKIRKLGLQEEIELVQGNAMSLPF